MKVAEPALAAATGSFWGHPKLSSVFPEYLFRVFCSARATLDVMAEAAQRSSSLAASDAVAERLARYLESHLAEERDHPAWLLADLEAVGCERGALLDRLVPASIAALAGAQHVWIRNGHPVAVLGLLSVLEGFPPTSGWLDRIERRTSLPPEAFRFLRVHAELDPYHAADLFRLLDELPLNERQASLIGVSALHTIASLGEVFHELAALADDGR